MTLRDFRFSLDDIDTKLLEILKTRFLIIRDLGKYKKKRGMSVYQPSREKEMLAFRIGLAKKNGLSEAFIHDLFSLIFSESRRKQSDEIPFDNS